MAAFIITSIKNILTFMKFLKLFKKKKKTVDLFLLKICRMHSYLNSSLFINFTVSLITYVSPSSLSPALTAVCISLSPPLPPTHTHSGCGVTATIFFLPLHLFTITYIPKYYKKLIPSSLSGLFDGRYILVRLLYLAVTTGTLSTLSEVPCATQLLTQS